MGLYCDFIWFIFLYFRYFHFNSYCCDQYLQFDFLSLRFITAVFHLHWTIEQRKFISVCMKKWKIKKKNNRMKCNWRLCKSNYSRTHSIRIDFHLNWTIKPELYTFQIAIYHHYSVKCKSKCFGTEFIRF